QAASEHAPAAWRAQMIVADFRLHIQTRLAMTRSKLDGSGTTTSKNPSPRIGAGCTKIEIEGGPAGKRNEAWLIAGSKRQMRGSTPHEPPLRGTEGGEPTRTPKSSTSKESPARNPSVIVKSTAVRDTNVHGGVSRFTVPMPGRHGTPPVSAGWQPATEGAWFGSNPNSYQMFGEILPAKPGLLLARSASNSAEKPLGKCSRLIKPRMSLVEVYSLA